jgi:hypothetical protein
MIETDTSLVNCPQCDAWPMAANFSSGPGAQPNLRFRCPRCRHEEVGRLRRTGRMQRPAENPAYPAASHRETR